MSLFDEILGQAGAVGTLRRALVTGRLHHAYRFEGPSGVGKEKAAFALAQALLCPTPPPAGQKYAACGRCSSCTRAVTMSTSPPHVPLHPDVTLIERGLYPPEVLRRQRPELSEVSVDQIRRLVLEHASFPPHEGRARVYIVRRTHELSTSAANALLKTLEEPIAATYFVLLTDRANHLLPTIRSRTLPVRFGPLPEPVLHTILASKGVAAETARGAIELAGGSADLALELADPKEADDRALFVEAVLAAMRAPDRAAVIALAEARARDKATLGTGLAALASHFARDSRDAAANDRAQSSASAHRYRVVTKAQRDLDRHGSAALVLEAMVERLRLSL